MTVKILQGNNLEVLQTLEPESVQTCVTSPPYWGLRDYGTARWIGGNDPDCTHSEKRGGNGSASAKQVTSAGTQEYQYRETCAKCGARREDEQIGLEETPEAYVENLVNVFRGVWRALKPDGTLWLNLGDSYAGSGGVGNQRDDANKGQMAHFKNPNSYNITRSKRMERGAGRWGGGNLPAVGDLKPKDLVGIPWLVAFALRADGWYLRSEIIWHKTNPMPESAKDRPTRAHEQIFLLSKSRSYFCDMDAIKEPAKGENANTFRGGAYVNNSTFNNAEGGKRTVKGNSKYSFAREVKESPPPGKMPQHRADREDYLYNGWRNKRDVWTVGTKPYRGAHFATFPPDLIEQCILAGSRHGDTVLDPFNGAGTTGLVSLKHGRGYIGIELNPAYVELTNKRLFGTQPYLYGVDYGSKESI